VAVASGGPYADLHLTPERHSRQNLTSQFFYGPDALPATISVKALKEDCFFSKLSFLL